MSHVMVSLIKRLGIVLSVQEGELHTRSITGHHKHDGLMPFFTANKVLQREYDKILSNAYESTERKEEVDGYKRKLLKVVNEGEHLDTCFHCNGFAMAGHCHGMTGQDNYTIVCQSIYQKTVN